MILAALAFGGPLAAATLEVSPTLVDIVTEGSATTSLRLRSVGSAPASVQIRVFHWRQANGADVLEPTSAVAVSPPFAMLTTAADYTIRVVRLSKTAISGEENYRIMVDELPAAHAPDGNVALAVRHSIPAFFRSKSAGPADVRWSVRRDGDVLTVGVVNMGDRRLRIAGLKVTDARGAAVSFGAGLAGYALGHGGRTWTMPVTGPLDIATVRVTYQTENGPTTGVMADATVARPGSGQS